MPFFFHSDGIDFKLPQKTRVRNWLISFLKKQNFKLGIVNYIFCSDSYLLNINETYLAHKTFTDIITFDYTNKEERILSGDIFISIERVKENSKQYSKNFADELHRVMIHGVLHLAGFTDKTKSKKEEMTKQEDLFLALRPEELTSVVE